MKPEAWTRSVAQLSPGSSTLTRLATAFQAIRVAVPLLVPAKLGTAEERLDSRGRVD